MTCLWAPMYGAVYRRKKKKSNEYYPDIWYYICKKEECGYTRHIRQEQLNKEMTNLVKWV